MGRREKSAVRNYKRSDKTDIFIEPRLPNIERMGDPSISQNRFTELIKGAMLPICKRRLPEYTDWIHDTSAKVNGKPYLVGSYSISGNERDYVCLLLINHYVAQCQTFSN